MGVSDPEHIACVGAGFVGLETALSFSEAGHEVTAVDTDPEVVADLERGVPPSGSAEDADRIKAAVESGLLRASTTVRDAANASVYVISVPTPVTDANEPDLSYLRAAAQSVSGVVNNGDLVVQQSTVYPSCTREVVCPAIENSDFSVDDEVGVAYVPERYSPGNEISKETPRIVGATSREWQDRTMDLYNQIATETVGVSSLETAESTKHLENIQRDVNIALMNEFAITLAKMGVDVWEVLDAADTKWNFNRYEPGLGVGGHCIAVDPYYFIHAARQRDTNLSLIPAARRVNELMPEYYAEQIIEALKLDERTLDESTVGVLGITYKPGVKDIRNSQALVVADSLAREGVDVRLYDPFFTEDTDIDAIEYTLTDNPERVAEEADCVLLGTPHDEFKSVNLKRLTDAAAPGAVFVDPYGLYEETALTEAGFKICQNLSTRQQGKVVSAHE